MKQQMLDLNGVSSKHGEEQEPKTDLVDMFLELRRCCRAHGFIQWNWEWPWLCHRDGGALMILVWLLGLILNDFQLPDAKKKQMKLLPPAG